MLQRQREIDRRRRRQRTRCTEVTEANATLIRRRRSYSLAPINMQRSLRFFVCLSICFRVTSGWSSPSALRQPTLSSTANGAVSSSPLVYSNQHPPTRIKKLHDRIPSSLCASKQSSTSVDSEQSDSPEHPPFISALNEQLDILVEILGHSSTTHGNEVISSMDEIDDDSISNESIEILQSMMSLYTWHLESKEAKSSFKFMASSIIDKAFRLVTSDAFDEPYHLGKVNMGMKALQLQLHPESSGGGTPLMALGQPYNTIPRGTWLRALRALTSSDINYSRSSSSLRSVMTLAPNDEALWITPSDAAFRILQRLVTGKGVRSWNARKKNTQHKSSLDERDFNMVLHSYAGLAQSQMHSAHRVMALQKRTPHAPHLSPVAYSILLKAYGRLKDIENVEMSILHAQRNGVVPDIVMANTVLDAYVNCGMVDKAQEIFYSMTGVEMVDDVEQPDVFWPLLRPNTRSYNTLLKGLAEEGDIAEALKVSKIVQSKGLWDDITTNTLVKAAVTASEFDLAESILSNHTSTDASPRRSDHPNVEAYTELLDGYAKDGQLGKALEIMQLMQNRGVMPNEYTYTCIVGALARNNKIRQARKLIDYVTNMSLPASKRGRRLLLTPTYNAFISGLLSDNWSGEKESTGQSSYGANILEALNMLQEMQDLNIHPNIVTVTLLIDGLGNCNPPRCKEAKELVQHLEYTIRTKQTGNIGRGDESKGSDISMSNVKIATALIRAFGRGNDVDSAIETFKRIPNPDVVALNALLDACCRCSQFKLALDMFNKYASFENWRDNISIIDIGPLGEEILHSPIKPDVVTYTSLISAILQLNNKAATKRATKLYNEMKQTWWISPDTVLVDT